jgi:hypothetical protein
MTGPASITARQRTLPRATAAPLACALRVTAICLLTPIVALLGLLTLAGLAILGAAALLQSSATSLRRRDVAATPGLPLYARAAAESGDARAVRQAV